MDDTILLGSASSQIARHLRITLDLFLKVFGSQLNERKSWLYGWNNSPNSLRDLAGIIGIQVNLQWTSFIYLEVPIVNKKKFDCSLEASNSKDEEKNSTLDQLLA